MTVDSAVRGVETGNKPRTDLLSSLILYMVHMEGRGEREMKVTSGTNEHG